VVLRLSANESTLGNARCECASGFYAVERQLVSTLPSNTRSGIRDKFSAAMANTTSNSEPWACVECPEGADCSRAGSNISSVKPVANFAAEVGGSNLAFYSCLTPGVCSQDGCAEGYMGGLAGWTEPEAQALHTVAPATSEYVPAEQGSHTEVFQYVPGWQGEQPRFVAELGGHGRQRSKLAKLPCEHCVQEVDFASLNDLDGQGLHSFPLKVPNLPASHSEQ